MNASRSQRAVVAVYGNDDAQDRAVRDQRMNDMRPRVGTQFGVVRIRGAGWAYRLDGRCAHAAVGEERRWRATSLIESSARRDLSARPPQPRKMSNGSTRSTRRMPT
jgi:hypothetical protein